MALENANFINQLNENNPDGLDPKSQGDDHLRVIKKALKGTFPNVTGAVSATHTQLNALLAPGIIPVNGMVMMWYGARATPPAGWLICDGTLGTPNMIDRFPMGAGATAVGVAGGAATHLHTATAATQVGGHVLTIAEIPNHSHGVLSYSGINGGLPQINSQLGGSNAGTRTSYEGGGAAHDHPATTQVSVAGANHIPPFLALWFIMKS